MILLGKISSKQMLVDRRAGADRMEAFSKCILVGIQFSAFLSLGLFAFFEESIFFSFTCALAMLLAIYTAFLESSLPRILWGKLAFQDGVEEASRQQGSRREMIAEKAAEELMEKIENLTETPLERQTYRRQLKALIGDEYCPESTRRRVLERHEYLKS